MSAPSTPFEFLPLPLPVEAQCQDWPHLKLVFLAGEPSGDNIGAAILAELTSLQAEKRVLISVAGTGGPAMARAGLQSLLPLRRFNYMGWLPVLLNLLGILQAIDQVRDRTLASKDIDAVVGIDAQGYVSRVFKALDPGTCKRIQVVAPTVWARNPDRAAKYAGFLDKLLCIYPFEPPLFEAHGLRATFVGHPLVSSLRAGVVQGQFRGAQAVSDDQQLVAVLPGSRPSEVKAMLPIFAKTVKRLKSQSNAPIQVAIPTAPSVASLVRKMCNRLLPDAMIVEGQANKATLFADADLALCCAGTAVIELALAGTPTIVGYRQDPISNFVWSRLWQSDASIVNILAGSRVQPEFILDQCTVDHLTSSATELLTSENRRKTLAEQQLSHILAMGVKGADESWQSPARLAALRVLDTLIDD